MKIPTKYSNCVFDINDSNKHFATMYSRHVESFKDIKVINLVKRPKNDYDFEHPEIGEEVYLCPRTPVYCSLKYNGKIYHSGKLVEGKDFRFI
jgi:hypothetical protein